jgi:hypothetical protein
MVMVDPLAAGAAPVLVAAVLLWLALGAVEPPHPAATATISPSTATTTLNLAIAFPVRWWTAMFTSAEVIRFNRYQGF